MAKKSRIDTDYLVATLGGNKPEEEKNQLNETITEDKKIEISPNKANEESVILQRDEPDKPGRKPGPIKTQISVYVSPEIKKELRIQSAYKIKENDGSSIASTGIEIVLDLTDGTYLKIKEKALKTGKSVGQICEEILSKHL